MSIINIGEVNVYLDGDDSLLELLEGLSDCDETEDTSLSEFLAAKYKIGHEQAAAVGAIIERMLLDK